MGLGRGNVFGFECSECEELMERSSGNVEWKGASTGLELKTLREF